jgi:uncharacterized protein involved in cysteine biosynthesis
VIAFATTTLVIVALLFAAALGVATAYERLVDRLRAGTPAVKHWGGYVLMVVGVWFVLLGAFAHTFARVFPV